MKLSRILTGCELGASLSQVSASFTLCLGENTSFFTGVCPCSLLHYGLASPLWPDALFAFLADKGKCFCLGARSPTVLCPGGQVWIWSSMALLLAHVDGVVVQNSQSPSVLGPVLRRLEPGLNPFLPSLPLTASSPSLTCLIHPPLQPRGMS